MDLEMYKKERREHPTLPDSVITQIELDHEKEQGENAVTFAFRKLRGK